MRFVSKLTLVLVATLVLTGSAHAAVNHWGALTSNTTWSSSVVHVLTGDVTVCSGVTLTIEPGAVVKCQQYCDLFVFGNLRAVGTSSSRITFTSYRDDTVGGDTNGDGAGTSPSAGSWGGIWFGDSSVDYNAGTNSGCFLRYCNIRWGGTTFNLPLFCGQVNCADAVPRIRWCNIDDGSIAAIRLTNPVTPDIAGCQVSGHVGGNGIRVDYAHVDSNTTWTNCGLPWIVWIDVTVNVGKTLTVEPGAVVKFLYPGVELIVSGTLNAGAGGGPMTWFTSARDDSVGGDTNGDGPSNGAAEDWGTIRITSTGVSSHLSGCGFAYGGWTGKGAIWCDDSQPNIDRCVFRGNRIGVFFDGWNASGTIRNCVFRAGTAADVWCNDTAAPTLKNCTMYGNRDRGIWVGHCSPTITNCIVMTNRPPCTGAYGIEVLTGSPTITYCDVYGNWDGNYLGIADQTGSNGNISLSPLFGDPAGGDFHLKSIRGRWNPATSLWVADLYHSPCVDAGNPTEACAAEPVPNGGRLNIGAYGHTVEASLAARRRLRLTAAACGSVLVNGTPHALPWEGMFVDGASVTITPVPITGWEFDAWSVSVPAAKVHDNPLTLPMTQDRRIDTHFKRERETLTIAWAGAGTVLVNGTPQTLPYTGTFLYGETVTVDPVANSGYAFQVWTGNVPASDKYDDPIHLVMSQDRAIAPHFMAIKHTLSIGWAGAGTVNVDGNLQTLPYSGEFNEGTFVTVFPVPNTGWDFQRWSGVPDEAKTNNPLIVTMNADMSFTPHFKREPRTLTIEHAGAGSVLVNGTPQSLPYSDTFLYGETVTVDPVANSGYAFQVWTGNVPASDKYDDPIDLVMNQNRTIDPHFISTKSAGAAQVALMGVTAHPAGAGVEVCFTLSAPASVSAEVLNIAGRPIKRIITDRLCDAGVQSLAWNGRSEFGTRVPRGVYMVRVTACTADGGRVQRLATVQMR